MRYIDETDDRKAIDGDRIATLTFHPCRETTAVGKPNDLVAQLCDALAKHKMKLFYQPLVDLRTGAIVGAEALSRWEHERWGNIPPSIFVPLAEKHCVRQLGDFVLRVALRQIREWDRSGFSIGQVSLNLSPCELESHGIADQIVMLVRRAGIPASQICFEITESTAISKPGSAVDALIELHDAGFSLAIDDFGTGYSNLSRLGGIPIDKVKIDKTFLHACGNGLRDREVYKAIVALAGNLGMKTIAEGIENAAHAAFVTNAGCDIGQGYYFFPPMPGPGFPTSATARMTA